MASWSTRARSTAGSSASYQCLARWRCIGCSDQAAHRFRTSTARRRDQRASVPCGHVHRWKWHFPRAGSELSRAAAIPLSPRVARDRTGASGPSSRCLGAPGRPAARDTFARLHQAYYVGDAQQVKHQAELMLEHLARLRARKGESSFAQTLLQRLARTGEMRNRVLNSTWYLNRF